MQQREHKGLMFILGTIIILLVTMLAFTGCVSSSRPNSGNYIGRKLKSAYFHGCVESYPFSLLSEANIRQRIIETCNKRAEDADQGLSR